MQFLLHLCDNVTAEADNKVRVGGEITLRGTAERLYSMCVGEIK